MNTDGLRDYQKSHAEQLFAALMTHGAALDGSDTGTGKTFVACTLARELGVTPLVVAPNNCLQTWIEVAETVGAQVHVVNYEWLRRKRKVHKKELFDGTFREQRLSYSEYGEERPVGRSGTQWVWKDSYALAIFDEVHRCGGGTTINSKFLISAVRQFQKVLCLSATAADSPTQLRALGFALRLHELKDYRWWVLKNGCKPGTFGGYEFTRDYDEQLEVMARIGSHIYPARGSRICKDEVPGFPKTQIDVRLIQPDGKKAAKLAQELRDEFERLMELAGKDEEVSGDVEEQIRTRNPKRLETLTRLRQALEILKVPDLVDFARDYARTSKVVLFVNYTETLQKLVQKLKKEFKFVDFIDGSNVKWRRSIEKHFQNNEIDVLVVNNQAGGEAISLHDPTGRVERTTGISPCFAPRIIKQVLGRVHRDSGAFSQQFFLYFAGTVEANAAAALKNKMTRIETLNAAELHGIDN